jgi:hypothetical protein
MRLINSVYELMREKHKIKVLWQVNLECGASTSELFSLPNEIKIYNFKMTNSNEKKRFDKYKLFFKRLSSGILLDDDISQIRDDRRAIEALSKKRIICIESCLDLVKMLPCHIFSPTLKIMEKVDEILLGEDTFCGVHIRRTDNVWSVEHSPDEIFEKYMQQEIAFGRKIYLATDDADLKQRFLTKYGSNIISQKVNDLKRENEIGIKEAYIDLLCLSRSKKIYGSYWSSFSNMAACIGNTELLIVDTYNL